MRPFTLSAIVFIWTIAGIGITLGCSGTELLKCIEPLESMAIASYSDPNHVCETVSQAYNCFEGEINKCPGPPSYLSSIRDQFTKMHAMCEFSNKPKSQNRTLPETDAEPLCSSVDIMECVKPLDIAHLEHHDRSLLCLKIHTAIECVEKEMDTCPTYMQPFIEDSRKQLRMARSMCDPFINVKPPIEGAGSSTPVSVVPFKTTERSSMPPCHWTTIRDCVWHLDELLTSPYHSDHMLMCQMYDKAAHCLKEQMALCPGYMPNHMWTAQLSVDKASILCDLTTTTKRPYKAGQRAECMPDEYLKTCLIHNQMPLKADGRVQKPSSQKDVCHMIGKSEACLVHMKKQNICNPNLLTRLDQQIGQGKHNCQELGYPINKAAIQQTSLTSSLLAIVMLFLCHHLL